MKCLTSSQDAINQYTHILFQLQQAQADFKENNRLQLDEKSHGQW